MNFLLEDDLSTSKSHTSFHLISLFLHKSNYNSRGKKQTKQNRSPRGFIYIIWQTSNPIKIPLLRHLRLRSNGKRALFFSSVSGIIFFFFCMPLILVVIYLFTALVGYLINPKINHSMHKLIQTPRVIKNKKRFL